MFLKKNEPKMEEFDPAKHAGAANADDVANESEDEGDSSQDQENDSEAEEEGDNDDNYGYEEDSKKQGEKKEGGKADNKPEQDSTTEPPKVEKPVTGYDKEPEDVEEPEKKEDPPKVEKIDLGYDLNIDGLNAENAKEIQEFIKANEFSQKQAQAFVDKRKAEIAEAKADILARKNALEKAKNEQRKKNFQELKSDPTFGGKNFEQSLARVEQVLDVHMSETKKHLTDRGSQLPPYVMRDLLGLWGKLYATEGPVTGNPPVGGKKKEAEEASDDPTDFYKET